MDLGQIQREWASFVDVVHRSRIKALAFVEDSQPVALLNSLPPEESEATIFLTIAIPAHTLEEIGAEDGDAGNRATTSAVAALLEAYLGRPWGSVEVSFVPFPRNTQAQS